MNSNGVLSRVRSWFEWHQVTSHIVAPIWVRIPTKWRWEIVHHLDRSQRLCWADLVSAAMTEGRESDACDVHTPLGCATATRCKTECSVKACPGDSDDHRCYCGKFAVQHDEQTRIANGDEPPALEAS